MPPLTLPVAETVEASTAPLVSKLPPVILPVAVINPVREMLAALMFPLPVSVKLLPVALPMFGVVKLAPTLIEMLPPPSNAVVSLSTLAENTVPFNAKPAAVLAV